MKTEENNFTNFKTQPVNLTPSKPRKKKSGCLKKLFLILISLMVFVLISIAGVVIHFQRNHIILPNVFVITQDLSLKRESEAIPLIEQTWNQETFIILESDEHLFSVPSTDLGLQVDAVETTHKAYLYGRSDNKQSELKNLLQRNTALIMPLVNFDENQAFTFLENLAVTIDIPAENSKLVQTDGDFEVLPSKPGKKLDVETTLEGLRTNPLLVLTTGHLPLINTPVEAEVADLNPLLDQINNLLTTQFILNAYDPITDEQLTWAVPQEFVKEWLVVSEDQNSISLVPDSGSIKHIINGWNETLLPERELIVPESETTAILDAWQQGLPAKVDIVHKPQQHTVIAGESLWSIALDYGMPLFRILEANPGLSEASLYTGLEIVIPSPNDLLPLPVVENKRIVISLSQQYMWTYENGALRSEHVISSGMEDSPTMAGIFQVQSRYLNAYASNWNLWMPHFLGIYEAWPDFMNGIHGLPTLSNGVRLWAGSLGSPASYGCIILDLQAAESLYFWAEDGVVVEIIP